MAVLKYQQISNRLDDIFGRNCSLKLAIFRPNMSSSLSRKVDILAQPYSIPILCQDDTFKMSRVYFF